MNKELSKMIIADRKNRTLTCKQCGYIWLRRIEIPNVCPHCHSILWNTDKEAK